MMILLVLQHLQENLGKIELVQEAVSELLDLFRALE